MNETSNTLIWSGRIAQYRGPLEEMAARSTRLGMSPPVSDAPALGRLPPPVVSCLVGETASRHRIHGNLFNVCRAICLSKYVSPLVSKFTLYLPINVNCHHSFCRSSSFFVGYGEINIDLVKSYLSNFVYGGLTKLVTRRQQIVRNTGASRISCL